MTPLSDFHAFKSKYITKNSPAVPLSIARKLETFSLSESRQANIAEGEIKRAHQALDSLSAPRHSKKTPQFSLSLSNRIRLLKPKGDSR